MNISPEQGKVLEGQVREIVAFVEVLQKVNTGSIEGYGLSEAETVQREDVEFSEGSPESRVSMAANHWNGMFLVPKVIGGGESA